MSEISLDRAREMLDIVVTPEDIVAKVPEFGFGDVGKMLQVHGISNIPSLPSEQKIQLAKEQKKALIFRTSRDSEGKEVNLLYLKERFGGLIYSSWYIKEPHPFAQEPLMVGWALVDLDPLPSSTEKTLEEQISYAEGMSARHKMPVADVYDLLVTYRVAGKFFRGSPLNGRTAAVVNEEPVKISHFDKMGMCISTGWGKTVKDAEIGAATELILDQ